MEESGRKRAGKSGVEILDEDEQKAVIQKLQVEAERADARESFSVALLCGVLAIVSAGLALCEVIYPWSQSLPHAVVRNSLPHWGVVATHGVGSLAHVISLFILYPPEIARGLDFLPWSFLLSMGTATVWLTAVALSGHFVSWPGLFIVINPATYLLASASVRDRRDISRSLLDMKHNVYKFKVV